jgi:hypothetical protein
MKNIKKLLKYQKIIELSALNIIILYLTGTWFRRGLLFGGGEDNLPFYNLDLHQQVLSSIWYTAGTGQPIVSFLPRLPYFTFASFIYNMGVPNFVVQWFTFYLLIISGIVSVYFILHITLKDIIKKFPLIPIIGSLFYFFNPFSMSQIWGRGLYFQFFSFALIPTFLLFFILGLRNRSILFLLATLSVGIAFSTAFEHPSQVISLWVPVMLYVVYFLKDSSKSDRIYGFVYLIFLGCGWLLTQAWWIYPYYKISSQQLASTISDVSGNVGTLEGVSREYPFHSLIRLMHIGYFFGGNFDKVYFRKSLELISWLIPFVSIFSLYTFKKSKSLPYFIALFLIGLFVCLGSNPPTGIIFEWLFINFPILQVFRNPFEKFGIVYILAYTAFFAIGVNVISQLLAQRFSIKSIRVILPIILLFLIIRVYLWPYWGGQFAGGFHYNPWVKVPEHYSKSKQWFDKQGGDFRIIHLPLNPGDGLKYSTWEHTYQGTDFSIIMFSQESISKNFLQQKPYYNVLLNHFGVMQKNAYGPDPDISRSEFKSNTLSEELAKLNVRYIVMHHDYDIQVMNQKPIINTEQLLKKDRNITMVNTFGDLDIYKVSIPDNIHILYSPEIKLPFTKFNPTLFKVHVKNADKPFNLYLLNTFDPGWQAKINGQVISQHRKVFSYANSWKVNKAGNFEIDVQYQPQDYLTQGTRISVISYLIIIMLTSIFMILQRLNKNIFSNRFMKKVIIHEK